MEILKKLALARMQMEKAQKSSANPFFKSRYADLSEVIRVVDEALSTQGLAVFQAIAFLESGPVVTTSVVDAETGDSYSFQGAPVIVKDPKNPQDWGSAITYARRYSLALAFCIAQEDDDGNAATRPQPQPQPQAKAPAAKPPQAKLPVPMPVDRFFKMLEAIQAGTLTKTAALELVAKVGFSLTDAQREAVDEAEENAPDASEVDTQP